MQWSYQFWCFLSNFYGFLQQLSPHIFSTVGSPGGCDALERFAGPRLGLQAAAPNLRSREGTALWDGGGVSAVSAMSRRPGDVFWWNIVELFSKPKTIRCYNWWSHLCGGWGNQLPGRCLKLANTLVTFRKFYASRKEWRVHIFQLDHPSRFWVATCWAWLLGCNGTSV